MADTAAHTGGRHNLERRLPSRRPDPGRGARSRRSVAAQTRHCPARQPRDPKPTYGHVRCRCTDRLAAPRRPFCSADRRSVPRPSPLLLAMAFSVITQSSHDAMPRLSLSATVLWLTTEAKIPFPGHGDGQFQRRGRLGEGHDRGSTDRGHGVRAARQSMMSDKPRTSGFLAPP